MPKTSWKTLSDVKVPDIVSWVKEATKDGQHLHIGTDSLQTGRLTQFVTVVVVLTPSKGGRVAYIREVVPRVNSLRQRLMDEVWKSVGVAMELNDVVKGDLTVHIDANPDEKHMSSRYLQSLVGCVVGQGFKAVWKPESWAASHAADWCVRHHGLLPKRVEFTHVA
jgi:predicted RNase H-related nuclease YkuK (DUF458 family)